MSRNKGCITHSKLKCFRFSTDAMYLGIAFDDLVSLGEEGFKERWEVVSRRSDPTCQLSPTAFKNIEEGLTELKRQPLADLASQTIPSCGLICHWCPLCAHLYPKRIGGVDNVRGDSCREAAESGGRLDLLPGGALAARRLLSQTEKRARKKLLGCQRLRRGIPDRADVRYICQKCRLSRWKSQGCCQGGA